MAILGVLVAASSSRCTCRLKLGAVIADSRAWLYAANPALFAAFGGWPVSRSEASGMSDSPPPLIRAAMGAQQPTSRAGRCCQAEPYNLATPRSRSRPSTRRSASSTPSVPELSRARRALASCRAAISFRYPLANSPRSSPSPQSPGISASAHGRLASSLRPT